MPLPVSFADFHAQALAAGFDEVLERAWPAHTELSSHTHPFAAHAWVVSGEMWLTVDGVTRHLRAGDEFSVAREQTHAERYGEQGTILWVARRHN